MRQKNTGKGGLGDAADHKRRRFCQQISIRSLARNEDNNNTAWTLDSLPPARALGGGRLRSFYNDCDKQHTITDMGRYREETGNVFFNVEITSTDIRRC